MYTFFTLRKKAGIKPAFSNNIRKIDCLKPVIIQANALKRPVLHAKGVRNRSDVNESEPLVQMSGMNIAFDNGIKL